MQHFNFNKKTKLLENTVLKYTIGENEDSAGLPTRCTQNNRVGKVGRFRW